MGYRKLMAAIESGEFDFESSLLKRVALQLENELNRPQSMMNEPHKKLIMHTFDYAQEAMKKEAKKIAHTGGTFYRDVESEHALMIIQDITSRCNCCKKAANMIELFVTNLMTVEEIEMIIY
jgi:hypothetical protein